MQPQFIVDAFATGLFTGNPAAVCPLKHWLDDALLQQIAAQNNLSETAFFVAGPHGYQLRWFTPTAEVDLCGHATLASAHVLFSHLGYPGAQIVFHTRSGELRVQKDGDWLQMDFPASMPQPCDLPPNLAEALGKAPEAVLAAEDYLVLYPDAAALMALTPDYALLARLQKRGVIVTAPGSDGVDFVSRFFVPKLGVNEDPVTGSAHCQLAPYWAERLQKQQLIARQLSKRGGEVRCSLQGPRVLLSGQARTYLQGQLLLT
ncbi:PhzF family phenazine biosynthesis protein [Alkalimonas sp. MEB108]|uniref:PhzF family phenazine biosynthesis protein n=1 Tax=Alkalimonas cellulosilytica TaxID=3058395 RepID=A0ABU7J1Y6_9GAMM|nr:PhzF family phenazine biosynthesis protein [Alkalimonas sp. MEB108]MEE2000520.1 PhzF family phenazine biosynthesis protein [Alkalimonas sp. MEB108]